jgi:hypothetical protein
MHKSLPIAFLAAGVVACTGGDHLTDPNGIPTSDLRSAFSHGTCAGTGVVRYAASPMSIADIGEFTPLGVMTGAHVTPVDHQYLYPADLLAGRTHYNVYAPFTGNIVLIQPRVKQAGDVGTAPVGSVDYRVIFEGSCTYWVYYDLVTQLEPNILAAGGSALAANNSANVRVRVTAGQLIGRVGGQSLDLGTVNADITLAGLLVPAHYAAEPWKVHSVDGLDYFDEPVRSQLIALSKRKASPIGGKIDYDVDGTASGNWFLLGTNGYGGLTGEGGGNYWSGHLSLSYGNIDPALLDFSMGFPDGSSQQWAVRGNAPDPATVTATNALAKYEVTRTPGDSVRTNANEPVVGVLLVQVLADRQLRVEFVPNTTAAAVSGFSTAARIYER